MPTDIQISFVIPVMNEKESLEILTKEIAQNVPLQKYEIIFVDDGSTDGSPEVIRSLSKKFKNKVKYIFFRTNFGKSAALNAGFKASRGKYIFTMDADLQDDPREIPRYLEKMKEGYDLVNGWKKIRHDPIHKTLPSKIFNYAVSYLAGIKLHDFNCGFKLYRREVIREINLYGEMHRFVPAFAFVKGFSIAEIHVKHHPRKFGKSKFGFTRFFRGLFDAFTFVLLTKYNRRPLHFFGGWGLLGIFSGSIILGYFVAIKLMGFHIGQRPLLFFGLILFISGLQSFSIGLIAELIIYQTSRYSKIYSIKESG